MNKPIEERVMALEGSMTELLVALVRQRAVNEAMLTWLKGGIDSTEFRKTLIEALK